MGQEDLTDLQTQICITIASYHRFPVEDVKYAFAYLKSFDRTLMVLDTASLHNLSVDEVMHNFITAEEINKGEYHAKEG